MLLGIHPSTAGGIEKAIERAHDLGCNTLQVFISNPRGWSKPFIEQKNIKLFKEYSKKAGIEYGFGHSIYLINLATENDDLYRKSINSLIDSLKLAKLLDLKGFVTHIGSHGGLGTEKGTNRVKLALNEILESTDGCPQLLLENTAGAGNLIGKNLAELSTLSLEYPENRLGICFDTAHGFEFGYDIASEKGLDAFVVDFDQAIGLDRLKLIHLNDSLTELGSNRDRHAEFGEGLIGMAGMTRIINHPKLRKLPFVMETPKLKEGIEGAEFISKIKGLANG